MCRKTCTELRVASLVVPVRQFVKFICVMGRLQTILGDKTRHCDVGCGWWVVWNYRRADEFKPFKLCKGASPNKTHVIMMFGVGGRGGGGGGGGGGGNTVEQMNLSLLIDEQFLHSRSIPSPNGHSGSIF